MSIPRHSWSRDAAYYHLVPAWMFSFCADFCDRRYLCGDDFGQFSSVRVKR